MAKDSTGKKRVGQVYIINVLNDTGHFGSGVPSTQEQLLIFNIFISPKIELTADVTEQGGLWSTGERLGRRTSKADLFGFLVCL